MNQLDKVREAVTAYNEAEKARESAVTALKDAEKGLRNADQELVRVLSHTVPGKAAIMNGRRYAVLDGGLEVVTCDDVVL